MAKAKVTRVKTGLAGTPIEKGYESVRFYFFTELDKADYVPLIKDYIKANYNKEDQRKVFANPDYSFNYFNYASMVYWMKSGFKLGEKEERALKNYVTSLIYRGKDIVVEKTEENKDKPKQLSPADRLRNKVQDTIFGDIDVMLDDWMDSKRTSIDIYNLVKKYDIKGIGLTFIEQRLKRMLTDYDGAYNKSCDQLVEGYSYLKRPDIKWFRDESQRMIDDIKKLQAVRKASRVPRVKKTQSADKQVSKLQFQANDGNYKLESINPLLIVGALELYVFNTKTRKLTVYKSSGLGGLSVKGTSIQNFSEEVSYTTTLRKPEVMVKNILTLTPAKLKKELEGLTTKKDTPNGRINTDTILLKVNR